MRGTLLPSSVVGTVRSTGGAGNGNRLSDHVLVNPFCPRRVWAQLGIGSDGHDQAADFHKSHRLLTAMFNLLFGLAIESRQSLWYHLPHHPTGPPDLGDGQQD